MEFLTLAEFTFGDSLWALFVGLGIGVTVGYIAGNVFPLSFVKKKTGSDD